MTRPSPLTELDGAPHDLDYFFDPACPFAWQTSQWVRRVVERKGIAVGWRFISLAMINEGSERPPEIVDLHGRGLRYLRICAAARSAHGNGAVGDLYRAWGERLWYVEADGEMEARLVKGYLAADPAEIVGSLGLPSSLLDAAEDPAWDQVIRQETDEALRRTGPDVGTPIITYDPPHGSSLFGPILSDVPDDETAVAAYGAVRTLARLRSFSELKRSDRAPLNLPLLTDLG